MPKGKTKRVEVYAEATIRLTLEHLKSVSADELGRRITPVLEFQVAPRRPYSRLPHIEEVRPFALVVESTTPQAGDKVHTVAYVFTLVRISHRPDGDFAFMRRISQLISKLNPTLPADDFFVGIVPQECVIGIFAQVEKDDPRWTGVRQMYQSSS